MTRLFLAFLCLLAISKADASSGQISLAGDTYAVLFEDQSLTEQQRQFLSSEIEKCFSYVVSVEQEFPSGKADANGFRHVRSSYNLWFPNSIQTGVGISSTPSNCVCVYRCLSEHFLSDNNLLNEYAICYAGATNFLSSINSGALTNQPISAVRSMFFISNETAGHLDDTTFSEELIQWQKIHFLMPSFFDFSIEHSDAYGGDIPTFKVRIRDGEGPVTFYAIAYINGQWRIPWYE
jgi:hypothetical protein